MNLRLLSFALALVVLSGCEDSTSSSSTSGGGGLQGAFKSAVAIKGEYQTFTFGPGNRFIYKVEAGTCLMELDTGTAALQNIGGTTALGMSITSGSGADWDYLGSGCAPIVKYTSDMWAMLGGPYPFRWVVQDSSFEIQYSPSSWLRFNRT